MPDSTRPPAEPRLGAALVFGGDASICVHVHTGPTGIAAIWDRLNAVQIPDPAPGDEIVHAAVVLGAAATAESETWTFAIPTAGMEELIAWVKGLNR